MQKAGVIKMGLYFIIKRPHRKYLGYGVDLTQVPGMISSSPFLPLTLASNIGMIMGSILYASCRSLFSQFFHHTSWQNPQDPDTSLPQFFFQKLQRFCFRQPSAKKKKSISAHPPRDWKEIYLDLLVKTKC